MIDFLRCARAFWIRDGQLALSYPLALGLSVAGTLTRVIVLWLPAQLLADSALFAEAGGFLPYAVVGTSMMGFFMSSYGGFSTSIRAEQTMGTLESVLMTPASVPALVLGSVAWTMTRAFVDTALMLGGSWIVYDLAFQGSAIGAVVVIVLTNATFAGIGLLSGAFTIVFKRGDPFRPLVAGASFLLGGVVYPTEVLPSWLSALGEALPVTHGVRALRGVVLQGHDLSEHGSDLLALSLFASITLPVGVWAFRAAIARAKRDGTLLHY